MIIKLFAFGLSTLTAVLVWSQTDNATRREPVPPLVGVDRSTTASVDTIETSHPGDRMLTPPPASGQSYPTEPLSEERSNYLRYGLSFTSAYTDNVLGKSSGAPTSDISYSMAPNVELDVISSRLHWMASYTPGFTFYQRTSARNEADHRAAIDFQYRLSPHVTVRARDGFWKSSNVFNQAVVASTGEVSGGSQVANSSVIAPIADQLSNSGYVGLTYQFALNGMIGANGTFTNLHYPSPEQVPGLFESSSQSGSAFYSLRLAEVHYLGVIYQYQRLIAHPSNSLSETQTQAGMLFYTFLPSTHFSLSLFGGPQYAYTVPPSLSSQGPLSEVHTLTPAAGASMNWQGRLTAFALSYAHMVAPGSGLAGAVHLDSATVSVTRRLTGMLSGSVAGGYSQNEYVGSQLLGNSGHSIYGAVSLQRQLGQRISIQLGYTRLHQSYAGVEVLSATPDINRGSVAISYQFSRPLGR
jgi:hypothetical protein